MNILGQRLSIQRKLQQLYIARKLALNTQSGWGFVSLKGIQIQESSKRALWVSRVGGQKKLSIALGLGGWLPPNSATCRKVSLFFSVGFWQGDDLGVWLVFPVPRRISFVSKKKAFKTPSEVGAVVQSTLYRATCLKKWTWQTRKGKKSLRSFFSISHSFKFSLLGVRPRSLNVPATSIEMPTILMSYLPIW